MKSLKVLIISLVLSQVILSQSYAVGPDCSGGGTLTCFTFFPVLSILWITTAVNPQHKEVIKQAVQGALKLIESQSDEEANRIISADSNLENALAFLQSEGFGGSVYDGAEAILKLAEQE